MVFASAKRFRYFGRRPLRWVLFAVVAALLLWAGARLYSGRSKHRLEPQAQNGIASTHSPWTPSASSTPTNSQGPVSVNSVSEKPSNPGVGRSEGVTTTWKTYTVQKYKFQLRYPADWLLSANVSEPYIAHKALEVFNIVSARKTGSRRYPQYQTVPVAIAVYANPSNLSLSDWLAGAYNEDLNGVAGGQIQQALARAYAGAEGIVSFKEFRRGDSSAAEVGNVSGGTLFYAGFFANSRSPYIYAVELRLLFDKTAEPADEVYASVFNQMLSTFTVIE